MFHRPLILFLALLFVVASCSSDDSDDTTTSEAAEETTTTSEAAEEPTTTTEATTATQAGVLIAEEHIDFFASTGTASPDPFEIDHIQSVSVSDLEVPQLNQEADFSCTVVQGQVVTTKAGAVFIGSDPNDPSDSINPNEWVELSDAVDADESVGLPPGLSLQNVLDPISSDLLGILPVPNGEEFSVAIGLLEGDHFADVNLVIVPAAKWQYGPASIARAVPTNPLPVPPGDDERVPVYVLDLFGRVGDDANVVGQHGEFISGIISRMGARPVPINLDLKKAGTSATAVIAASIQPGVNNISMGTPPCLVNEDGRLDEDGQEFFPPLVVAAAIWTQSRELNEPSTYIAAAAGNRSDFAINQQTKEPIGDDPPVCGSQWYPAAFADTFADPPTYASTFANDILGVVLSQTGVSAVVSVAASAADTRAQFSHCGVNSVWMPGANVISDYNGGAAVWDGTSFATPQVAAQLAAQPAGGG